MDREREAIQSIATIFARPAIVYLLPLKRFGRVGGESESMTLNKPTPRPFKNHGAVKTHFTLNGVIFCFVKPRPKLPLETASDWREVTCGNCLKGNASREWRELERAKVDLKQ